MNLQVFSNEEFGEVRVVIRDGEPWFVAADVCRALELGNTSQALSRLDDDEKGIILTDTPGGKQNMIVINEPGLYTLVLSSRKPEAKNFKRWLTHEVIPTIRKTGSYSTVQKPVIMTPLAAVDQVTSIAVKIKENFSVHQGIALAQAISLVEPFYGNTLEPLRKLLPPAKHDTGYLNPTQIGQKLGGLAPQAVNRLLSGYGLQYKEDNNWRLTAEGKIYGEEIPYTRNGHSGYQIRWSDNVLSVIDSNVQS